MSDILDQLAAARSQAAGASTFAASATSADQAARVQAAADRLGLPAETVQRNEAEVGRAEASQAARGAPPPVQTWLADPGNAAVSHDVIPHLADVARWLPQAFAFGGRLLAQGPAGAVAGLPEMQSFATQGGRAALLGTASGVAGLASLADRAIPVGPSARTNLAPASAFLRRRAATVAPDSSLAGQAGALVGGLVPFLATGEAAPAVMAGQGADQEEQIAQAKGVSGAKADAAVVGNAALQALLGAVPVSRIAEGLVPELGSAATTALARFGIGTAGSAATGAAMSVGANAITKATVDPTQSLTEGAGANALTMGLLHAAHAAAPALAEARRTDQLAAEAPQEHAAFNEAVQAVRASSLGNRSPDRLRLLGQEIAPDDNVFVPAEPLRQQLEALPADQAQALTDKLGIGEQLDAATVSGAKVVMPASDYLAYVAPTPLHDALSRDLSLGQDRLSLNEGQAATEADPAELQAAGEAIGRQAQAAAEAMQPQQRVYDEVRSQVKGVLRERGVSPVQAEREANQTAALTAARYATRADRLGTDAYSEFRRAGMGEGLQFRAGDAASGERRGEIGMGDGPATVRLFGQADRSTIPHELGHAFLEELRADAARDDAPQQVKDDYAAVSQHLGLGSDAIPTEAHEQFARGFERYLTEGKAPSEGLRGVFQRFRDWLTRIYRNVQHSHLAVNIDPIRGVYDRLLATDDEISAVEHETGSAPAFASPEEAGMTKAEFAAYEQARSDARESAREKLMSRAMRDLTRQRTKEWSDERARIREAVAQDVDARPDARAWRYLVERGDLDGAAPVKLRRDDVADAIGGDAAAALPRGREGIVADTGAHPDDVAELTGHASGEAMLRDLLSWQETRRSAREMGDRRSPRDITIDAETDSHMAIKHGDLLDPNALHAAALDSIHDDLREKVLQIEARALERRAGEPTGPWSRDNLKAYAEGVIGRLKTREVRPSVYLRAERQAANETQRHLQAGKPLDALAAKRRQIASFHLYRAALDAESELGKMQRTFTRFARKDVWKSIDQGFFNQITSLLHRFSLRAEGPRHSAPELAEWVEAMADQGRSPVVATQLLSPYYDRPFSEMSVEEARDLSVAITSIAKLGRDAKTLTVQGKRVELEALANEAEANVAKSKVLAKADPRAVRPFGFIANARATLLRMETMADMMDMNDPNGPFNRVLVRGASEANAHENELQHGFMHDLRRAYESAPWEVRRSWLRRVDTDLIDPDTGRPIRLTKANVIGMALNLGSAENEGKLDDGFGWAEGSGRALAMRTLSADEWRWVQGVWDTLDGIKKTYFDAEESLTGVRPREVLARPVETPHGVFPGGYFPLKYDPTRNRSVRLKEEKTLEAAFGRKLSGAATRNGAAQERTAYAGPLHLSPEAIIFGHMRDVTKRIAWGRWYLDAQQFLQDPRIEKAINTRLGREFHDAMSKLSKLSVGYNLVDERSLAWAERMLRTLRTNAVTAISGINPRIIFEHAGAHPQSIAVIGKRYWAKGLGLYLSDPIQHGDFVLERSAEMRARKDQANREIADLLSDLNEHRDLVTNAAEKAGINPQRVRQLREVPHVPVTWTNLRLVAMPTWLGGYLKHLDANPGDEEGAVAAGDKAVRVSHSSGAAKDLSVAQSGSEFYRMFTTFFAYHLNQWNLYERMAENIRQARSGRDYARSLESFMWAAPMAALVGALVSGRHPEDMNPSEWGMWLADTSVRALWEGLPIVRNIGNGAVNLMEGKAPDWFGDIPQAKGLTETGLAIRDSSRMALKAAGVEEVAGKPVKDPSPKWMQHLIEAPGFWFGLPTTVPARTAEYAKERAQGTQQPQNALQEFEGYAFGPPPKRP